MTTKIVTRLDGADLPSPRSSSLASVAIQTVDHAESDQLALLILFSVRLLSFVKTAGSARYEPTRPFYCSLHQRAWLVTAF